MSTADWEPPRPSDRGDRGSLMGVNAEVVGILAAALYDPVFTAGVLDVGIGALAVAVVAFVALNRWKVPAWAVVIGAALLGWLVL